MRRGALLVVALCLALAPWTPAAAGGDEALPEPLRELELAPDDAVPAARAAFPKGAEGDALVVSFLRDDERRTRLAPRTLASLATLAAERGLKGANAGLRAIVRDGALPREVRAAAIDALGRNGSLADVSALGDAVAEFPLSAANALAAIGGDTAKAALARNESADAPLEIAAALAKMGEDAPLGRLVQALNDPAKSARAAQLLRWATGKDLPPDLGAWQRYADRRVLARLFAQPDARAAQTAVQGVLDDRGLIEWPQSVSTLCDILADPGEHPFARAKAALALGLGGCADKKDVLLAATVSGTPGDVRRAAIDALARVGDLSCAVPLVRGLVDDTDLDRLAAKRAVRQEFTPIDPAVVRTLFRFGIVGGVEGGFGTLLELLEGDYRTGLHRDAMRAFAEVSGGQLFGYEPDAAKSDRLAAVARMRAWWRENRETLPLAPRRDDPGRAAFDRDVEALVQQLGELKFLYAWRARMALAVLAEPAHERLVAALSDPRPHVRMGAAEVLENTRLRRSATALASRLADETHPAARMRLLSALESCARPDPAAKRPLDDGLRTPVRAALADRNLDVRIAAARALGPLGDGAADADLLRRARAEARNEVDAFRTASAASLLRLGDRSALADVVAELRSGEVARRAEGLRLLRAAGFDVPGYDPDAPPEVREEAIRRFEAEQGVPSEGRK